MFLFLVGSRRKSHPLTTTLSAYAYVYAKPPELLNTRHWKAKETWHMYLKLRTLR